MIVCTEAVIGPLVPTGLTSNSPEVLENMTFAYLTMVVVSLLLLNTRVPYSGVGTCGEKTKLVEVILSERTIFF